jgi:hypothetical protein
MKENPLFLPHFNLEPADEAAAHVFEASRKGPTAVNRPIRAG